MIFTLKIAKNKRPDALVHYVLIVLTMGNDQLLFEHVVCFAIFRGQYYLLYYCNRAAVELIAMPRVLPVNIRFIILPW